MKSTNNSQNDFSFWLEHNPVTRLFVFIVEWPWLEPAASVLLVLSIGVYLGWPAYQNWRSTPSGQSGGVMYAAGHAGVSGSVTNQALAASSSGN